MQTIKLNKQIWGFDESTLLGSPGGFGEVFRGSGDEGDVAIKRLKVIASAAAHRELQIGQFLSERSLKNIVPILDYGQDADSDRYFIVMPICDHNLQDEIDRGGALSPNEAIQITLEILAGLSEVPDIAHRDLKPSNILLHESKWKIADFGIAKFVEDSTSLETLRSNLTPSYAAPEQWQLQRPTNATDIYAVGCIVHTLITGQPPFTGDMDALYEHHMRSIPPPLNDLPSSARGIVFQMLRKSPDVRPKLDRCISVFQGALCADARPGRNVDSRFAQAVSDLAITQARREAESQAYQERKDARDRLFNEAAHELIRIKKRLFNEIMEHAADVMDARSTEERLVIGNATLKFDTSLDPHGLKGIRKSDPERGGGWGVHNKQSDWDIVGFATISIEQQVAPQTYTRSANIIFGKPNIDSEYRWYEVSFWDTSGRRQKDRPHYLEYVWDIDKALSNVMGIVNLAHAPVPIDGENEDSFIEYWMELVVQAVMGKLTQPPMPITR